jgi:hypothetical protein
MVLSNTYGEFLVAMTTSSSDVEDNVDRLQQGAAELAVDGGKPLPGSWNCPARDQREA